MKMKKLTTFALATAMAIGTLGISVPAKASAVVTTTTDYTITIPAKLSVASAGWNKTDGITAQWTKTDGYTGFDTSKKLTVTAASGNKDWTLKSGENSIGYNLATASDDYSATATPASWEFSAEELNAVNGTKKDMGINVQDYTQMSIPAGEYKDTVTFTAKVEYAAPATVLSSALVDGATIKVNFKWRGIDRGDYVQGVYNASSGTFTVSKGGDYWGDDDRAVYKVEKSGDNIIIGAGFYGYDAEGMVWTFNTTNDTYTYTQGSIVSSRPSNFGLISVTLNGTDITSQLTKN